MCKIHELNERMVTVRLEEHMTEIDFVLVPRNLQYILVVVDVEKKKIKIVVIKTMLREER